MRKIKPAPFIQGLLVTLTYFATGKLGLWLGAVSGFATLVWAPTGISLAALVLFGWRLWPFIFTAALVLNWTTDAPLPVAAAIAVGNTLEALIGAYALKRWGIRSSLEEPYDVAMFLGVACGSTLVSATVGVLSLWWGNYMETSGITGTWLAWWVGDVLGDLTVAPVLLVWMTGTHVRPPSRRAIEIVALCLTLIGMEWLAFENVSPLGPTRHRFYLLFLPLIWAALRFGQRGATLTILAASILTISDTTLGYGPFLRGPLSEKLTSLQLFMAVATATTLLFAAVVEERRREGLRPSDGG